ncbi:MAG: hypothetical protein K940chlam7_00173 [Chlamydiae bacterium]|nr:hypothetical protein [Chlamydiota bacterium]
MSTESLGLLAILPREVNLQILSFLDIPTLWRCGQVSRELRRLSSEASLWRELFPKMTIPDGMSYREYIATHAVGSMEEVVQRIHEFVLKVPLNQKGVFTCIFLSNPGWGIRTECSNSVGPKMDYDLEETAVFIKKIDGCPNSNSISGFVDISTSRPDPRKRFGYLHFEYRLTLPYPENVVDEIAKKIVPEERIRRLQLRDYIRGKAAKVISTVIHDIPVIVGVLAAVALNSYFQASNHDEQI